MAHAALAPSTRLRLPKDVTHDISVVIVSYNTRELTIDAVRSVKLHSGALSVEIIVVDNQSKDGSSAALRAEFPDITVIDSPANGGFAYGNAIGFEQARGSFILLLNPDARVHADTLRIAMSYMRDQPQAGILGARVWLEDGTQQSSMMRFLTLRNVFINMFVSNQLQRRHAFLGDTRYASRSLGEIQQVDSVSGCFMLVRRAVLKQVGGLDTRFFMYGEETEWCHRAKAAGWQVIYHPEVQILHHGAASTAHMSEWKAVEMARGQILFMRFTRGPLVAWLAVLIMALRDFLRAPLHVGAALFSGLRLPPASRTWWVRLRFLLSSLLSLPKGQFVDLPDPALVR
jgi:N-acetylglucosaminyl-diphospho-decaprenol L-rhamnosyltransferase